MKKESTKLAQRTRLAAAIRRWLLATIGLTFQCVGQTEPEIDLNFIAMCMDEDFDSPHYATRYTEVPVISEASLPAARHVEIFGHAVPVSVGSV